MIAGWDGLRGVGCVRAEGGVGWDGVGWGGVECLREMDNLSRKAYSSEDGPTTAPWAMRRDWGSRRQNQTRSSFVLFCGAQRQRSGRERPKVYQGHLLG